MNRSGDTSPRLPEAKRTRLDSEAGFAQLLTLLEREGAPKSRTSGPACVTEWHCRSLLTAGDRSSSRTTGAFRTGSGFAWLNNYVFIISWVHQTGCLPWYRGFTRPYRVHGAHLVTFANGYEIKQRAWHGTRVMSPCLRPTPNREAQVATERGPLWMSR
jgi:hypothetical protein